MKKILLTVVIPARNEELDIVRTLEKLRKNIQVKCRYIVVDDQSVDGTVECVNKYKKRYKDIHVLQTSASRSGFASALRKGFGAAKTEYVLPVMADSCDDPRTVNVMFEKIFDGYDVVAGSRYMARGGKKGGPKLQGAFSKIVCLSLFFLTGVPTHDVTNSFKLYKKSVLKNLKIDDSFGVEISMYLLLQAYFKGYKIAEVPTYWTGRTKGVSKFKIFERMPRYFKIYWWAIVETAKAHI